jgi:uncharacterized iron-regulated protein
MCDNLFLKNRGKTEVHSAWIQSQKRLFKSVYKIVQEQLGYESRQLRTYQAQYLKFLARRKWRPTDPAILQNSLLNCTTAIIGDFHPLNQSQKVATRLLRLLPANSKATAVLALECFSTSDQKWLDRWMKGQLSDDQLRQKTKWDRVWSFPWKLYLQLLLEAKQRHLEVRGIDVPRSVKKISLSEREKNIVAALRAVRQTHPERKIILIIGDYHLTSAILKNGLKAEKILRVFQNSEALYWKFGRSKNKQFNVFQSAKGEFCVLSTTPFVKWKSYSQWLEQGHDSQDFDSLWYEDIMLLKAELARLLGLAALKGENEHFDIHWVTSRSEVKKKAAQKLSQAQQELVLSCYDEGKPFLVPELRLAFLTRKNFNQLAELSALLLLAEAQQNFALPVLSLKHLPQFVFIEMFMAFGVKMLNPHKKSDTLRDLKTQLKAEGEGRQMRLLKMILNIQMQDLSSARPQDLELLKMRLSSRELLKVAQVVGAVYGERMYFYYLKQGPEAIVKAMSKIKWASDKFVPSYISLVRKVHSVPALNKSKLQWI